MLRLIASLLVVIATVGAALASSLAGSFAWVTGTLTAAVTGKSTPQTISIKVGATTYSYPNAYVAGTTMYPIGTPFTLLLANSRPFAATFTVAHVVVLPDDASGVPGRVTVPMTSSGFISNTIGYSSQFSPLLRLHYPPCTVGALNFSAGILASVESGIANYNVTVPAPGAPTLGTAAFSPSVAPPNNFSFNAVGNGILNVVGSGNVSNLAIAATETGASTHFTTGTLMIGFNAIY